MKSVLFFLASGIAFVVSAAIPFANTPLDAFWRANDGKVVRRLPVDVLPENVFMGFSTSDFYDKMEQNRRILYANLTNGTYNCITLTLRCNPELGDSETCEAVDAFCTLAHEHGVKVYMDTDPRIARREFFSKWPDDLQGRVRVCTVAATNGTASFSTTFDDCNDHMSWGSQSAYRPIKGSVLDAFAVMRLKDGALDLSHRRAVRILPNVDVQNSRDGDTTSDDGFQDRSKLTISGSVDQLNDGETLVVLALAEYYSIDVFAPGLVPFIRQLMVRYQRVGADGGMRDEWGFLPDYGPDLRTFFWSRHFAAAYAKETRRNLTSDLALMALGEKGSQTRSNAIGAYFKVVRDRNVEIERDFYETDKRLFGNGVYVCKHPTWFSGICPQEYFHNGLDWWQAPRDWAQSDETTPVYVDLALAKKFGGPVWMNEGYTADPVQNAYRVWTYALCGGRQVYHGLWGDSAYTKSLESLPPKERAYRMATDLVMPTNVVAQSRVRLTSLITRAHPESHVAWIFGDLNLMDFSGPSFNNHGRKEMFELLSRGWWIDAYPASEIPLGTIRIDGDGFVAVGDQRYPAIVLWNLRKSERARFDALVSGKVLKTHVYDGVKPMEIVSALEKNGARAQPKFKSKTWAGPFQPIPDGETRLLDGTIMRISADKDHLRGLPISGELVSNGAKAEFSAEGVFAIRGGSDGSVDAIAAGGLKRLKAPGIDITLYVPADIALVRIDGELRGAWQTADEKSPVPPELKKITKNWMRLLLPTRLKATNNK